MRYTTIIDISEIPAVWTCESARRLYLYLVLKSGYHDDDRDQIRTSFRAVAARAGLSESAARHAVKVLETAGLLRRAAGTWTVTKWVMTQEITARAKTVRQAKDREIAAERERQQRATELANRKRSQDEADQDLMTTYERFMAQQAAGEHSVIAANYLAQNKARYEALKQKQKK